MVHVAHKKAGFSLLEVIIAVTIIGILSVAVVFSFNYVAKAKVNKTHGLLKSVDLAIQTYYEDVGSYPTTLMDLVQKPGDERIAKKWNPTGYLKKEPMDAWGRPFVYRATKGGKQPYELYSVGPKEDGPEEDRINVWDL